MPCKKWVEKLMMHEEELSPAERRKLEKHLLSCPACSQECASLKMLGNLLRTLPAPAFPAGLSPRILKEMDELPATNQPETSVTHESQTVGATRLPNDQHITYQLQFRKCGRASCSTCRDGQGHGPYWYAYWREGSRLRSGYIGKVSPEVHEVNKNLPEEDKELPETLPEEGKTVIREFQLTMGGH